MKQTIDLYQFRDAFSDYDRLGTFTFEGLEALFMWFEEFDDDCGTETELDVIAICCDFTEYANLEEFQDAYTVEDYPNMEAISDDTVLIPISPKSNRNPHHANDGSFIIKNF